MRDASPTVTRETTQAKLAPGKYALQRTISLNGTFHRKTIECGNPAYGIKQLDKWELELMKRLPTTQPATKKAAA